MELPPEKPEEDLRLRRRKSPEPEAEEEQPRRRKAPRYEEPDEPKKKKKGGAIGLIVALVIVLLLLGAVIAAAFAVQKVPTIYAGVEAGGVDLGGMSVSEARTALDKLGHEKYDGYSVTAQLPLDNTLTVRVQDVSLLFSSQNAAEAAWNYGRADGLLGALVKYAQCRFLDKNSFVCDDILDVTLDENALRSIIHDSAVDIDEQLLENAIIIGEEDIRITKGAVGLTIDEEEVFRLFYDAFMTGAKEDVVYESQPVVDEAFDFQALYDDIYAEMVNAEIIYNPEYLTKYNSAAAEKEEEEDAETEEAAAETEEAAPATEETAAPEGIDFNGEPYIVTQSVVGMSFDVKEAERLWAAAGYGDVVVIPLDVVKPETSTDEINAMLFRDGLSENWTLVRLYNREPSTEVRTSLSGSTKDRISNVKLACEKLNGIILIPGQSLSYNEVLGQRLDTLGWLPATAYANGEVRQEYGGGICQVSSTLYNAALYSNLEILERECHQFQVGYLPLGMDATVSWGWPDFKFRNNQKYPIMILAHVDDDTNEVCVEIRGTDVDHTYVLMRFNNWEFFDKDGKYHDASGNPLAVGMEACTWRCIYHDGDDYDKDEPISKELEANSKYNYHTEDILARNVPLAGGGDAAAEG